MSREESIAMIQQCAKEIGHVPSLLEVAKNNPRPPTCDTEELCFVQRGPGAKRPGTARNVQAGPGQACLQDWAGVVREARKTSQLWGSLKFMPNTAAVLCCGIMAAGAMCQPACWNTPERKDWKAAWKDVLEM